VGEPINSTLFIEIRYTDNGAGPFFDDTLLTYGSPADLADKIKEFLENILGGVFTVTCVFQGSDVVVQNITGIASPGMKLWRFWVDDDDGVRSEHLFSRPTYEDPHVALAIAELDSTPLPTDSITTCLWTGVVPLNAGADGIGELGYVYQIFASRIEMNIEIRNPDGQLLGNAFFRWNNSPIRAGGYQCDRFYQLSQVSAWSEDTPHNNRGPAPSRLIDWSGALIANMNEGQPSPIP